MLKRTKIIATVGPKSESAEVISKLILAGTNLFRFNLKHNDLIWHELIISRVRAESAKLKIPAPVIMDLQGPELRLDIKDGTFFDVKEGDLIKISTEFIDSPKSFRIIQKQVCEELAKGDSAFIDDGNLELKVVAKKDGVITVQALQDGVIKNRKSVNLPGKNIDLPLLTQRDHDAIDLAAKISADFVALSFVRTADDVLHLRKELDRRGASSKIISKIENATALKNLESIVQASDAIMVARGDLGIEVPLKELAIWQKRMIDLCRQHNKPVIVATQMLMSMVDRGRPTRAEATDVANAVFDGTDVLMLSDETAVGVNPVRVVKTMAEIASYAENLGELRHVNMIMSNLSDVLIDSVAKIISTSQNWPISAAIVFTKSGHSAKVLSTYRLSVPVIAVSDVPETLALLSLSYGVIPYLSKLTTGTFKLDGNVFEKLVDGKFIEPGSQAVIIHGTNWLTSGSTRSISIKQF